MSIRIRLWNEGDLPSIENIWNGIVAAGDAFPGDRLLTLEELSAYFKAQSAAVVAEEDGTVLGVYVLHPNGIGRAAHIANASYGVLPSARGRGIGALLVKDSLRRAKALHFGGLQFNAVVASNQAALRLYEALGFSHIGVIPGGFRNLQEQYEDTHILFYDLRD